MRFTQPKADVYVPAGGPPRAAIASLTQLGVAAHQDDVEIMSLAGICDCLNVPERLALVASSSLTARRLTFDQVDRLRTDVARRPKRFG